MLGVLEAVAARAGQALMEGFNAGRGLGVLRRKPDDVTREIDAEVESLIYSMLRSAFPEGGLMVAEEGGVYRWGDERHIFVVDPLDGSLNYASGIPIFSVSIAAGPHRTGTMADLQYAVVAVPPRGEVFSVSPATGPLHNGRPASRGSGGEIAFVALGNGAPEAACRAARELGLKVRSLGSSAAELAYTALGRARGFADLRGRLRPLDVAGALVFGRAMPGFRYVVYGGESLDGRLSVVAGDTAFVEAVSRLWP